MSTKENLERFAAGMVIRSFPGLTAFPVLPASELFSAAAKLLTNRGVSPPFTVFDPCCGGGYIMTVLGLRHSREIQQIICSDINPDALKLAQSNLALLTGAGMAARVAQLTEQVSNFGKDSHRSALRYAAELGGVIKAAGREVQSKCFNFDLLGAEPFPPEVLQANIIFADIPYGIKSEWHGDAGTENPIEWALSRLRGMMQPATVLILATAKKSVFKLEGFTRSKKVKFGARMVQLLERVGE